LGEFSQTLIEDHRQQIAVLRRQWNRRSFGQAVDVFLGLEDRYAGFDAVVHLAAIQAPGHAPDAATFENNMLAMYDRFQAARRAGIK
jgi:nucleoside-diphosphate-sugar epimerase